MRAEDALSYIACRRRHLEFDDKSAAKLDEVCAAFFEFRRQLEYQAAVAGSTVIVADRWFYAHAHRAYLDVRIVRHVP